MTMKPNHYLIPDWIDKSEIEKLHIKCACLRRLP